MHLLRLLPLFAFFSVIDSLPIPRDNSPNTDSVESTAVSLIQSELATLILPTAGFSAGAAATAPTDLPLSTEPIQTPLVTDIPGMPLPTDIPSVTIPFDSPQSSPTGAPQATVAPSPSPAPTMTPMYTSVPTPPQACIAKVASLSSTVAQASAPPAVPTDNSLLSLNPNGLAGRQGLVKRIAQTDLHDVAQSWQDLCMASGGDIVTHDPCVQLAGIKGINALLADADTCDQQDNADAMIDFAKSAGVTNSADLIANAIAYRKHPRNAVNILGAMPSTSYCQKPPRNQELLGIANDQLPGLNPYIFGGPTVGMVPFGDASSCPFGQTPDVVTCSCTPISA